MVNLIGWDIGGAHLKAVLLNAEGSVVNVKQIPCPLWLGLDKLETSMLTMLNIFDISPMSAQHSVTMTGELVDLFDNRKELANSSFSNILASSPLHLSCNIR